MSWTIYKLSELCNVFTDGDWIESKDQSLEGIRLLQTGNIGIGVFKERIDKARYVSEETFKRLNCEEVFEGDLLISRLPKPVGRGCLIPNITGRAITAVDCTILRVKSNLVDKRYLEYFIQSQPYQLEVQSKVTGTTRQRISRKNLGEIPIVLPPLPVQKQIVEKLDAAFADIDKVISATEKNIENAETLFDKSVSKIFVENAFEYETKRLSDISEYFNGLTYSPKDVSPEGVIVLRSSNIQNNKMDYKDLVRVKKNIKDKLYVLDSDILICSRNGSKRLIGKSSIIGKYHEKMTFGTFMMIVRSEYNEYLKWFFISSLFKKQISRGENTMINQITRYMLDEVIVPFPEDSEKKQISLNLNSIYEGTSKLIDTYRRKLQHLDSLKTSILNQAFSGELTKNAA